MEREVLRLFTLIERTKTVDTQAPSQADVAIDADIETKRESGTGTVTESEE